MARTTIDLDPQVVQELRRRSQLEGKSMGRVASEVLAAGLAQTAAPNVQPLRWAVAELGAPYVDLEDREAVQAILDDRS
jgi:hypothetical protein